MEVKLAEHMGFCFGVKRAVDTVYEQIKNGKTIYTYGSIVNNEEVVRDLAEKGVRVLETREELTNCPKSGRRQGGPGQRLPPVSSSVPMVFRRRSSPSCRRSIWNASTQPALL